LGKKKGEKLECKECGLVVVVDSPCGCTPCDLVCCGTPLEKKEK
jgi:hypothetical protein